jgi:hypothetical protein
MSKKAIVVTISPSYLPITALFLDSLRLTGHDLEVVVCHTHLTETHEAALRRHYLNVRLLDINGLDYPIGPPSLGDRALNASIMYARLLIWSRVFDDYDQLLYMDCDQIVVDALDPLFAMGSFTIIADYAPETILTTGASTEPGPSWLAEINSATMANAGVFCVDRSWRTPEQTRLLESLCRQFHDRLRWGDQSLINLWMIHNRLRPRADLRFNCQVQLGKNHVAFPTAAIYHFCGMSGNRQRLSYTMKLSLVLLRLPRGRVLLRCVIYLLPPYRILGVGNAAMGRMADAALGMLANLGYALFRLTIRQKAVTGL